MVIIRKIDEPEVEKTETPSQKKNMKIQKDETSGVSYKKKSGKKRQRESTQIQSNNKTKPTSRSKERGNGLTSWAYAYKLILSTVHIPM